MPEIMEFDINYSDDENPTNFLRNNIADFLYDYLEEYRDTKSVIKKSIDYAYGDEPGQDGLILIAHRQNNMKGVVVINRTNMSEFIPGNILVYIAIHKEARRQGLGKELMNWIIKTVDGDIVLHVEPDNPAKFLYKKVGFTNRYLEMRYSNHK